MIYVFDTSSLRSLQHFYPSIFKTIWVGLDAMIQRQTLSSTREVWNELEGQAITTDLLEWAKSNKHIFRTPIAKELEFVAKILQIPHFQKLISEKNRLKGMPVADPFVIACAKINGGTVVTEEGWDHTMKSLAPKQDAAKIPNVCQHFGLSCTNLEGFMRFPRLFVFQEMGFMLPVFSPADR